MNKYRIIKFDNGKFGVQVNTGFLSWRSRFEQYDTVEEAKQRLKYEQDFDKEWAERQNRKVAEVIE